MLNMEMSDVVRESLQGFVSELDAKSDADLLREEKYTVARGDYEHILSEQWIVALASKFGGWKADRTLRTGSLERSAVDEQIDAHVRILLSRCASTKVYWDQRLAYIRAELATRAVGRDGLVR